MEDHGLKDLRHHGALEGEGEAVFHQLICRGRKILRTLDGLGQPALTLVWRRGVAVDLTRGTY